MLWNRETGIVSGETGMFIGKNSIRLLFPAEKILKVYNSTLEAEYQAGRDFSHERGSDILYALPGTEMPMLPEEAIYPDPETAIIYPQPGANAVRGGADGKYLLFSAENFFARNQISVDYQAVSGTVFPENPVLKNGQLPRVSKLLKEGGTLRVTLIGDSISEGINSTKIMNCPPYAPTYIESFAKGLESKFNASVEINNSAVNGTGCQHAFVIEERWKTPPCDLLVIAYGMNDFARLSAQKYSEVIQEIMRRMHEVYPETEFLLITSMSGNALWKSLPPGADLAFAEELRKLESSTVAIGDVNPFWNSILERKDFYDITGNGVNHPNDYGYRIYAKVLLDLFG